MSTCTPGFWYEVERDQAASWRRGRVLFGYNGVCPPAPRGLLIGEAPGPNTDARMPLFPWPRGSAGARLLKYSGVDPCEWMGKLVRMNMCSGSWSERRATAGRARVLSYLLDPANFFGGRPLRVLLLGIRVARAWDCHGPFGHETHRYAARPLEVPSPDVELHVAWIPHPSGRNLLYNQRRNQLRARRAVLWAIGERASP